MNAMERLTKAKVLLLLDHPFFGTLATRLENILDPGVPTAATNGKTIRWNPKYLATLTDAEVRGVMAHEVLHVANGHVWRRGGREMRGWNEACDKAINPIITGAGLTLPAGALEATGAEAGKAAETIYSMVPHNPAKQPQPNAGGKGGEKGKPGPGNAPQSEQGGKPQPGKGTPTPGKPQPGKPATGPNGKGQPGTPGNGEPGMPGEPEPEPGCGEVEDAPAGADPVEMEGEWKIAVAQAAASVGRGSMPGGLARMVAEIVEPKVAWETILRDFVERTAKNDYNWAIPNRRYLQSGIILPSLVSEELPAIVVAVDTSGSIGKKELDQFASEVGSVLGAYETTIHVIYVDTRVAHHQIVTRAELPLKLEPKGGGGTAFEPAFKWVEAQGIEPAAFIYLTDGDGSYPRTEPAYPVLWVMVGERKAPWGETVPMNFLKGGGR